METRKVTPCGMLYSQGREYFLLFPRPVERDSWQGDNLYRWLVVPRERIDYDDMGNPIYSHARHVVSNAFIVDYTETPEIRVRVLDEYDVADLPAPDNGVNYADMPWLEVVEVEDNV